MSLHKLWTPPCLGVNIIFTGCISKSLDFHSLTSNLHITRAFNRPLESEAKSIFVPITMNGLILKILLTLTVCEESSSPSTSTGYYLYDRLLQTLIKMVGGTYAAPPVRLYIYKSQIKLKIGYSCNIKIACPSSLNSNFQQSFMRHCG